MPTRKISFISDSVYHVFNHSLGGYHLFGDDGDFRRFMNGVFYYQFAYLGLKYSRFNLLDDKSKLKALDSAKGQGRLVEVIAFSLLPSSFSLLLRQKEENGISVYMSKLSNSYSRYFNTKYHRLGPLFQGRFKVKLIQPSFLLSMSRYVHLKPYFFGLAKDPISLENYFYSSLPEYTGLKDTNFWSKELVLSSFSSKQEYKNFVFDWGAAEKELEVLKGLFFEKKVS